MKWIIGLMIVLVALTGCFNLGESSDNIINVQGSSELTFQPDEAEVWAGIQVTKLTAEEAQNEAKGVINAIIAELKAKGYTDIETERLSLYEDRRWEEGKSKVVGWRASQTLKISTTNLDKVGEIVDIAVTNGANQVQNINFGLSESLEQKYKKQALAEATKNAKEKAATIASSLGVKLGKVKNVSERNYFYNTYVRTLEAKAVDDMVAEAAQVLPQDVNVQGQISIIYHVE